MTRVNPHAPAGQLANALGINPPVNGMLSGMQRLAGTPYELIFKEHGLRLDRGVAARRANLQLLSVSRTAELATRSTTSICLGPVSR